MESKRVRVQEEGHVLFEYAPDTNRVYIRHANRTVEIFLDDYRQDIFRKTLDNERIASVK